ncbi:MAG: hypothetical protein SGI77_24370 [Pirellulaceae bacterium]|nr:hypothetical protein [Pirellulaceae bacterium]
MKFYNVRRCLFAFLTLLFLSTANRVPAQDSQPNDGKPEREQTIYVPFSKLRDVFEKEGRGVFLPYDQFQKLWNAARDATVTPPHPGPPVDSIITEASNEATVLKDVVQVDAALTIELLKSGWNSVPLRLKGAAIQSATIEGNPARLTATPDGGYQLLVQNDDKQPRSIMLKITYARAFEKTPGENAVTFEAPQAPVNRWKIRIPQAGVKVNVSPMIAATEDTGDTIESTDDTPSVGDSNKKGKQRPAKDETVLLAFVGSAPEVAIRWTPKAEGATGMAALVSVQTQQEVLVSEGAMRTRVGLTYSISRSQLTQMQIDVPLDHKVVNVFDPNVRKWDVTKEKSNSVEVQRISVELFEPADATQRIAVELEKFLDSSHLESLSVATVRAVEVGRQQGIVVVQVDPALRAESTTRNGLLQIDAAELPTGLANQTWTFAYRYAAVPFELTMSIEKINPRINVEQLVECYLEPEQISLDVMAIYSIEQAGVFQLELDLPEGYQLLQVKGRIMTDVQAAAVDSFHTEGDNPQRLIVNLARKAIGKNGLYIQLQKRLNDPNLRSPTGTSASIPLSFPEAKQDYLNQFSGKFIVYAPESLRLTPSSTTGMRAIGFSEAFTLIPTCRDGRFESTRPTLAYAFTDQPKELELSVERRSPYVTAQQTMVTRVDSGVVVYETNIVFEIRYSGVKSLRIDVPSSIAADVRNISGSNPFLRDAVIEPTPDDVREGYVAWSLTGESELIGSKTVRLTWEQKLVNLEVGSSQNIDVPRIIPMNVDRSLGQLIVTKADALDVQPADEPAGLRSIDPMFDVAPNARVNDAALAFEYVDDWTLKLKATRYQLEEVKRTSIERALVRTVVTRSNQRSVQALYRMRSARQRLAIQLPKDAVFDSQPVRLNGRPVSLERGDQDSLYVPLNGQDPNNPFVFELRYTVTGNYREIDVPIFPEDPAVQKIYLAVFVPDEMLVLNVSGPWTEEYTWQKQSPWRSIPLANRSDDDLQAWLSEGIATTQGPGFQKDGVLYLFSALQPSPPPDGTLRLFALHEKWLAVILIGILAVVGILFLRSPIATKFVAVTVVLIAAVACGVFAPTLGRQLVNLPTIAGLAIIGIAWAAWSLVSCLKQIRWKQKELLIDGASAIEMRGADHE